MRKKSSKGKQGTKVKCPKCRYPFRTNQKGPLICCSRCKRWFKRKGV